MQPPGREELWKTPPFEPTVKEGPGGARLYGRGTADDKAGVIVHSAAIDAFSRRWASFPVNVKVVIEGEEEIGSSHLEEFLKTYRKMLDADVLVLTDTGNFDCGVPALTVALRGLVGVEVEVRALSKTVHSGMWGGPVPDPAMALSKMLATLTDANGDIAIPGVCDEVKPLSAAEKAEFAKIPYNEKDFREQSGMIDGVKMLGRPAKKCRRSCSCSSFQVHGECDPGFFAQTSRQHHQRHGMGESHDPPCSGQKPEKVLEQLKAHLFKPLPGEWK